MTYLYDWVRNIVLYILMISIFEQMLPGGTYKKYMKVVSGFILVFITIWPLMKISGNEENLLHFFDIENMRVEEENRDFELVNFENVQKKSVLDVYRLEIEKEVLAEVDDDSCLKGVDVNVVLEDDEANENFGQIKNLEIDVVEDIEAMENYINDSNIKIEDIHIENIDDQVQETIDHDSVEYEKEIEKIKEKLAEKLFMKKEDIRIVIH